MKECLQIWFLNFHMIHVYNGLWNSHFQSHINENDMSRAKKLEDELFHMGSDLKKAERKYEVSIQIND